MAALPLLPHTWFFLTTECVCVSLTECRACLHPHADASLHLSPLPTQPQHASGTQLAQNAADVRPQGGRLSCGALYGQRIDLALVPWIIVSLFVFSAVPGAPSIHAA